MIRKAWVVAALAASLTAAVCAPATAQVYVEVAPPPPRVEHMPPPRHGHAWVSGHWEWRRHGYRWVPGHWVAARPGYRYHGPEWVARDGRWYMERGRWERDRDHDGVPNRFDRHPNDPSRR